MKTLRGPLSTALVAVLTLAILLIASAVNSRLYLAGENDARALEHAQELETRVLTDQLDQETGIRGFVATGSTLYLQPYRTGLANFAMDASQLKTALLDLHATDALAGAQRLRDINARWRRDVAEAALARPHADAVSRMLFGKTLVDAFRVTHQQILTSLNAQLVERQQRQTQQLRISGYITLALIVLTAVAIVLASWRSSVTANRLRAQVENQRVEQERNRQFTTILATIPQIVWTANARGNLTFLNDRWFEFTGSTAALPADVDAMFALVHPAERTLAVELWRSCLRAGEPFDMEFRLLGAHGRYQWFDSRAVAERAADGTPTQWFGTFTDVDEHHRELEETQKVADALQDALLPERLPRADGVEFDATYVAAEEVAHVGGDWYDVLDRGDGTFLFSIGDVTGHGLSAAIDMGKARHAIVSLAAVYEDPAELLQRANIALRMQTDALVSALAGVYDARTGDITVASAGHPPGLLIGYDRQELLGSSAPPLGVLPAIEVSSVHRRLGIGELFVCYTDGVIEQTRDIVSGERELLDVATAVHREGITTPARAIRRRILGTKRGRDDVAILTIARLAPAGHAVGSAS